MIDFHAKNKIWNENQTQIDFAGWSGVQNLFCGLECKIYFAGLNAKENLALHLLRALN